MIREILEKYAVEQDGFKDSKIIHDFYFDKLEKELEEYMEDRMDENFAEGISVGNEDELRQN